ncbi:hypothetical protein EZV62_026940 [Acer yangbiense]|uniref:Rho termination factor-like N-terminal domain-containing protein n=1 Tax=Acer yangbiense TaxID=1000413 RepID=A0A5C7GU67_9ROSI|nr:hypothetical protein EZV62_026940 [Acer yangbiense]
MGVMAFYPQSMLSFNKQLKLRNPIFSRIGVHVFRVNLHLDANRSIGQVISSLLYAGIKEIFLLNLAEIADWPSSPFAFQKNPYKLTVLNINSDGSRRGGPLHKVSAAGRSKKGEGGNEIHQLSDGNGSSSNQDEIIALFRRIQSSISERETVSKKKRNPSSSKGKTRDELKDSSPVKDGVISKWRREDVPKTEQEIQKNEPVADRKLTRLPSNFVKRSPIPSPSTRSGKVPEQKSETEVSAGIEGKEQSKLPRVEELKLPQLKELAKARGIKGYSRMKKSELVKLLRS